MLSASSNILASVQSLDSAILGLRLMILLCDKDILVSLAPIENTLLTDAVWNSGTGEKALPPANISSR
jgi:hypothetical protein